MTTAKSAVYVVVAAASMFLAGLQAFAAGKPEIDAAATSGFCTKIARADVEVPNL